MKKNIASLIVFVFMLLVRNSAYATSSGQPLETVILNLPNNEEGNWKEVDRRVSEKQGIIERIPKNQNPGDWSQLITIQFYHKSLLVGNQECKLDISLNRIQETALESHPNSKVTWKVIEKNKDDGIYEEIVIASNKDEFSYHTISRCFLTKTGFHSVGFLRKDGQMDTKEREKWICLLKGSAKVVSLEAAGDSSGLSMAHKLQGSLDLGSFNSWKVINADFLAEGTSTLVFRIPPNQTEETTTESLVILARYNLNSVSLDQLLNEELKLALQESILSSSNFSANILKRSSNEYIIHRFDPTGMNKLNMITRAVFTDTNNYILCYSCYHAKMSQNEILQCQEKLEKIKLLEQSL